MLQKYVVEQELLSNQWQVQERDYSISGNLKSAFYLVLIVMRTLMLAFHVRVTEGCKYIVGS